MSFSIVKVRSSLNYSIIGIKIKHIQGGIIDKMDEIHLKFIDILCGLLLFHGPRRICDTNNVRFIIYLEKLIMQRVTVSATGHSATGDYFPSLN